jgi:hypothetical protein
MSSCAHDGNITSDGKRYSKFEARISKFETKSNVPNSKVLPYFAGFEHSNFEFVSDFDIRISDFSMPPTCPVPAMPG